MSKRPCLKEFKCDAKTLSNNPKVLERRCPSSSSRRFSLCQFVLLSPLVFRSRPSGGRADSLSVCDCCYWFLQLSGVQERWWRWGPSAALTADQIYGFYILTSLIPENYKLGKQKSFGVECFHQIIWGKWDVYRLQTCSIITAPCLFLYKVADFILTLSLVCSVQLKKKNSSTLISIIFQGSRHTCHKFRFMPTSKQNRSKYLTGTWY